MIKMFVYEMMMKSSKILWWFATAIH